MKKILGIVAAILLSTPFAFAQNTTTLTGTITDSAGTVWKSAAWTARPRSPIIGPIHYTDGTAVPASFSGTLNSSGAFAGSVGNVAAMLPAGVVLDWQVCSVTSAACSTFTTNAGTGPTGATFDMGASASALVTAPLIPAAKSNYAYNANEIINPVQGTGYTRTSDATQWLYNGNAYVQVGGGSGGGSVQVKYVSQLGCDQDGSFDTRTGTDAGACISAALANATPSNRVVVIQDGVSAVSEISAPATGNWELDGIGGGFYSVDVTNCTISGNVVTLDTKPQTLAVGKVVTVGGFTACTAINNARLTLTASTSTSITASFTTADVASTPEDGTAAYLYGTGFVQLAAYNDVKGVIHTDAGNGCAVPVFPVPVGEHGNNVSLNNFVLDGNSDTTSNRNGNFCFSIYIPNMNHVSMDNVLLYSPDTFNTLFHDGKDYTFDHLTILDRFPKIDMINTLVFKDGIHFDGNVQGVNISNVYLRTNDDPIALNADESTGGISDVNIVNGIVDMSNSMLRVDTSSNGLHPVSNVHITNYNGSVYNNVAYIGNQVGAAGSEDISNFTWSDSTVSGPIGFRFSESVKDFTLSNFRWVLKANGGIQSQGEWFLIPDYIVNVAYLGMVNDTEESVDGIFGGVIGISRGTGAGSGFFIDQLYLDGYNYICSPGHSPCTSTSFLKTGPTALGINNLTTGVLSTLNWTNMLAGGWSTITPVLIPGFTGASFPLVGTGTATITNPAANSLVYTLGAGTHKFINNWGGGQGTVIVQNLDTTSPSSIVFLDSAGNYAGQFGYGNSAVGGFIQGNTYFLSKPSTDLVFSATGSAADMTIDHTTGHVTFGGTGTLLATNGYDTLPSGRIHEWGVIHIPACGTSHCDSVATAMPLTFPNAVYSCTATVGSDNPVGGGWNVIVTMVNTFAVNNIQVSIDTTQTSTHFSVDQDVSWQCDGK